MHKPFTIKDIERVQNETGLQFPKDITPLEIDLQIQANRIIYVLDRLLDKLDLIAMFPVLVKDNYSVLNSVFNEEDACFIKACWQSFTIADPSAKTFLANQSGKLKPSPSMDKRELNKPNFMGEKQDPVIFNMVDMLDNNKLLRKIKEEFCRQIDKEKTVLQFIKCIKEVRELYSEKLSITGTEELKRDAKLREAYRMNVQLKKEIDDINELFAKRMELVGGHLEEKQDVLISYETQLKALQDNYKLDLKQTVHNSEKVMMMTSYVSDQKLEFLTEEAENIKVRYENLIRDHVETEKNLRTKRLKIEAQLSNWIAKYDQDIGDKTEEYEKVLKLYEEEESAVRELQKKYEKQKLFYQKLMKEKAAEEAKILREKLALFVITRACKIIQRYWREYRIRKKMQKKDKKKKKK